MDAGKYEYRDLDTVMDADDGADASAAGPPSAAAVTADLSVRESEIEGACPSITHPQTRQRTSLPSVCSLQGSFNIDWWEVGGCIQWESRASEVFDEFERHQNLARQHRQPVPFPGGDGQVFIHERGMGTGRGSYLEVRLEWLGATIGLSQRNEATRLLSNFSLKIPGEACLVRGVEYVRDTVAAWITEWGGTVQDEWIRRLDLCLDVAGLDLHQAVFPACQASKYLSTVRRNGCYRDADRVTGFSIGSSPGAKLTIYDKLAEVRQKNNSVYAMAMIERRWGGTLPEAAARVEYQLHRGFFQQFAGLKNTTDVIGRLPDVVERLIQTEKRPFFKLTDGVPDRKGRHQNRVDVLPEWAAIVALIREKVGQPRQPLKRLERFLIDAKRACSSAIGYLAAAAAQLEIVVEGKADLVMVLQDLMERNDITDEVVKLKWEDKARRCGTWTEVTRFPFGANQAI